MLSSRQFDLFPFAAHDGFTDFFGALAHTIEFISQENLLKTNLSVSRVVINVTMQQTAVPEAFVAEAIAGLLREDFRNAARRGVGLFGGSGFERGGIKRFRERLGRVRVVEIMRDVLRDFGGGRCRMAVVRRSSRSGNIGCTLTATIQQQHETSDDNERRPTSRRRIEYLHKNRTPFKISAMNLQNISAVHKCSGDAKRTDH
jgi:hypothetical protein